MILLHQTECSFTVVCRMSGKLAKMVFSFECGRLWKKLTMVILSPEGCLSTGSLNDDCSILAGESVLSGLLLGLVE